MDSTETTREHAAAELASVPNIARDVLRRASNVTKQLWIRFPRDPNLELCLCLIFVSVLRLFQLRMPVNPDGFHKWDITRDLLAGQAIKAAHFDHHAARWAVNLPIAAAQSVFGSSAVVAYVPLLCFDLLQALLTYLLGAALGSRAIGLGAVVLFSVVPKMNYVGSELLPTVFESTYILAACYAVTRAAALPGRRWLYVSLAFAFAAYLAKETTVFFLPGLLLGLFLTRRNLWECVGYAAGFGALIALETALYRALLGFPYGRLSIIAGHHLNNPRLQRPIGSLADLFERYTDLSSGFRELFFAALVISLSYPWWRGAIRPSPNPNPSPSLGDQGGRVDRDESGRLHQGHYLLVALACWSFFICSTFALKSLHPPQLAQPANERYLLSALPLLALVVSGFLVNILRAPLARCWGGSEGPKHSQRLVVWGATALVASISVYQRGRPWSDKPLVLTPQYEAVLHQAFDAGLPIVGRTDSANALTAVASVFLDRERSRDLRCVELGSKRANARVCVNQKAKAYRTQSGKTLSKKALRRKLSTWSKTPHVEVTTTGGFQATLVRRNEA